MLRSALLHVIRWAVPGFPLLCFAPFHLLETVGLPLRGSRTLVRGNLPTARLTVHPRRTGFYVAAQEQARRTALSPADACRAAAQHHRAHVGQVPLPEGVHRTRELQIDHAVLAGVAVRATCHPRPARLLCQLGSSQRLLRRADMCTQRPITQEPVIHLTWTKTKQRKLTCARTPRTVGIAAARRHLRARAHAHHGPHGQSTGPVYARTHTAVRLMGHRSVQAHRASARGTRHSTPMVPSCAAATQPPPCRLDHCCPVWRPASLAGWWPAPAARPLWADPQRRGAESAPSGLPAGPAHP
jgi:hypothetical protein